MRSRGTANAPIMVASGVRCTHRLSSGPSRCVSACSGVGTRRSSYARRMQQRRKLVAKRQFRNPMCPLEVVKGGPPTTLRPSSPPAEPHAATQVASCANRDRPIACTAPGRRHARRTWHATPSPISVWRHARRTGCARITPRSATILGGSASSVSEIGTALRSTPASRGSV